MDIAVANRDFLRILAQMHEKGAQILEIEKQQSLVVGDFEGNIKNTFLRIGQVHQAGKQKRSHFRYGRADRMALFSEEVPEDHGELLKLIRVELDRLGAREQEVLRLPFRGDAGKIALYVGAEYRDARIGEGFGKYLERHGLARAGCAGDQAMTVGVSKRHEFMLLETVIRLAARAEENPVCHVPHGRLFPLYRCNGV
jgi:hypothetical protein